MITNNYRVDGESRPKAEPVKKDDENEGKGRREAVMRVTTQLTTKGKGKGETMKEIPRGLQGKPA